MAITITWNGDTTGLDYFMDGETKWVRIYNKFISEQEMVGGTVTGNGGDSFTYEQMKEYSLVGTLADGLVSGLGFYSAKQGTYTVEGGELNIPADGIYVVGDTPDGTYTAELVFPNANTETEQKTPLAEITYNGETIAQLNAGETCTLKCGPTEDTKYVMASDVVVKVAEKIDGAIITSDGQYFIVKESE